MIKISILEAYARNGRNLECLPNATETLVHFSSSAGELSLPVPDFGDTDSWFVRRVTRETRGHNLKYYRDPTWPRYHQLTMRFQALTDAKIEETLQYLRASNGLYQRYLDPRRYMWLGVITNPDTEFETLGPLCQNYITLEFEGEFTGEESEIEEIGQ
jgi:hypothetical protein